MAKEIVQQISHIKETVHRLNIQQSDDHSEITKQYGYLKFDEDDLNSTTRLCQYIRLALHTDPRIVVEFLQQGWCLPTPDLIISVTGGGKRCKMSVHLRKTFQRGLVVAAATTNAWLITGGRNVGVVKEVGKALNNYRYKNRKHGLDVPCIGVCTWEYTAGSEQLDIPTIDSTLTTDNDTKVTFQWLKSRRSSRVESSIPLDVANEHYVRCYLAKQSDTKRYELEPNHTHFLIFDGQSTDLDTLLLQHAKIEEYSCQIDIKTSRKEERIPAVMILLEGGSFSVRTVCQALRSNTPLVVVKGSNRAADLVADLHTYFSQVENDPYKMEQKLEKQSNTNKTHYLSSQSKEAELNSIFEKARADNCPWVDEVKWNLSEVLFERKHLVVIFEFDSPRHHGNLEDAILEALINAAKFSGNKADEHQGRVAELNLAMAWQKFDYAQKSILTDSTISQWREIDLRHALVDALRRGYVDFVELLMDYGTSLDKLTLADLEQLYASSDASSGLPVEKENEEELATRNDYYSTYFPDQFESDRMIMDKNAPLGTNARREFFLWSIFVDRFELGKYLCSKTWNQSVAPLVAARIYHLAATMALHSKAIEQYENNASQFDKYAMSIIDRCFQNDEAFAVDLLKQPAVTFDHVQPLELAEEAECRSFLASECVQRYLDHKWFGNINYKIITIHLRIFLCSMFLPLLPFFSIFLSYVQEQKQVISSQNNRNPVMIQTVIKSDRDKTSVRIGWSDKVIYFYKAPIVRFWYNVIFFILFLGLFSYVLLIDFLPMNVYDEDKSSGLKKLPLPVTEIILHIWIWSLIIEEVHQFTVAKFANFFSDLWNFIDIVGIVLYLIAFVTRFIRFETSFIICKIFLCLDLIIWFVRTLQLFASFERLGPKLVMIFNTMKDLFFFICFILIFLCAFSITSWSLITSASQVNWIYSDDGQLVNVTVTLLRNSSRTWHILRDITHYGVWKVFGQIDPIEGTDTYSNVAFILAIIFVAIANILLLNVLIALFNVTIQNVQEQSHDLWRYQRFLIVKEFSEKPILPPPFNIIFYIFMIIRYPFTRIRFSRNQHRSSMYTISASQITSEMLLDDVKTNKNSIQQTQVKISDAMRRESAIAEDFWFGIFKHNINDRMEINLQNIEQKIDRLKPHFQDNNKYTMIHRQANKQINVESDV